MQARISRPWSLGSVRNWAPLAVPPPETPSVLCTNIRPLTKYAVWRPSDQWSYTYFVEYDYGQLSFS